jgi:hypothetical protein
MKIDRQDDGHPLRNELQDPSPGLDPLRKAERESRSVDFLWLKQGESQTILQKVGFTIISLLFIGPGLMFLGLSVQEYRNGIWSFWLTGAIATVPLGMGLLGLRNVLRFPPTESKR